MVTIAIAALLSPPGRTRHRRARALFVAVSRRALGTRGLAIAPPSERRRAASHRADALSGGQAVAYAVKNSGKMLAGYVARVVQLSRRTALWLVGRIEAMLSIGRRLAIRLAAWLASLPLTVTGLSRRFQQWLRSAGYRAITVARAETTPRRIVTLGFSCVVVILSYVRWGTTGAAVAVAGVGLGAVVSPSGLTDDTDRPTAASSSGPSESVTDSSDGDESALPSLRDIWRAFAGTSSPDTGGRGRPARCPGPQSTAASRGHPSKH